MGQRDERSQSESEQPQAFLAEKEIQERGREGGRRTEWLDDDESLQWLQLRGQEVEATEKRYKDKMTSKRREAHCNGLLLGCLNVEHRKARDRRLLGKNKHLSYSLLLTHVKLCDKLSVAHILQVRKMRPRFPSKVDCSQRSWPNFQLNFEFFSC